MSTDYLIIITVLLLATVFDKILSDNVTVKYHTMQSREYQMKQNRLISFNTEDGGDISMELAFNVPFIRIPVKKSIQNAHGAIANVNIGAIVLGGAVAFGFGVLIPLIVTVMTKKAFGWASNNINSGYRNSDSLNNDPTWWRYLTLLDQALTENDIDSTSCLQRMVCWTVKNSSKNGIRGQSSSNDKIIDGFATSQWLQQILEGTAIHEAIMKGLDSVNCAHEYSQCKITQKNLQMFAKNFVKTINNSK